MQQAAKPDRVPVLAAIFRWIDRPLAFLGAGLLSALETAAAMMTPVLLQGLIRSVSEPAPKPGWNWKRREFLSNGWLSIAFERKASDLRRYSPIWTL